MYSIAVVIKLIICGKKRNKKKKVKHMHRFKCKAATAPALKCQKGSCRGSYGTVEPIGVQDVSYLTGPVEGSQTARGVAGTEPHNVISPE